MQNLAPHILTHTNYREFLRALYALKKSARSGYSWRRFAQDLGLNSSNFLHLVVTGKRNLSQEALETIKKHLDLTAQEKKFFHYLVLLNQEADAKRAEQWQLELDKILGKKRKLIPPDQFAYFSTWYIPVIREILALKDFKSSLGWIARKLKPAISPIAVREALRALARLQLIAQDNGAWRQTEEHLTTPAEVTGELVHKYHKEMLKLSNLALDMPATKRDVSAMTMSVSPKQMDWIKQRLVDLRDEIQQELQSSGETPTLVAQLNMQLFPVTEE